MYKCVCINMYRVKSENERFERYVVSNSLSILIKLGTDYKSYQTSEHVVSKTTTKLAEIMLTYHFIM